MTVRPELMTCGSTAVQMQAALDYEKGGCTGVAPGPSRRDDAQHAGSESIRIAATTTMINDMEKVFLEILVILLLLVRRGATSIQAT